MIRLKSGSHFMSGGYDTAKDLLNKVNQTTIKFAEMDFDWLNDTGSMELINLAKSKGLLILGRRAEQQFNLDAPDMYEEVRRYFYSAPAFPDMIAKFPQVDIWEGPNEVAVSDKDYMLKYATAMFYFADLMKQYGKRAGIGGWAVGNPDLGLWQYYRNALVAVKDFNAVLTRHSYGPLDVWYSYRHRQDELEFQKLGFTNTPVLITEYGADKLGNFPGTWKEVWGDNIQAYWNDYLKAFEEEIGKDNYVLGAHLFTVGSGGGPWNNFDVAHTALADAIVANPPVSQKPSGATHMVTADVLNVRQFPWCGNATPMIMGTLGKGSYITSLDMVKFGGMTYGWHLISVNGNMWVSGKYLVAV